MHLDPSSDLVLGRPRRASVGARQGATRYLAIFFAPLLVAVLLLLILGGLLARMEETTDPITAAREQNDQGGLYGPTLIYRPFPFMLERYRLTQPDVLIVGSSRVMPFPGEVFKAKVLNSGGAANNIDQVSDFVHAATAIRQPKTILIGLDFWWFNPNHEDDIAPAEQAGDDIDISLSQLLMPLQWVDDGYVSVSTLLQSLSPFHEMPQGIGALAKFGRQGWDSYGRYDYGGLIDGAMKSNDRGFQRTLKRLSTAKNSSKFGVDVAPAPEALQQLGNLARELEGKGIEVLFLLPPIATPVRAALARDPDNRLLPLWHDAVQSLAVRAFDFEDATLIGSLDCEFVDGFHGGEVTYLRILDAIGNFGGTFFANSIDRDMVADLIAANAGHARLLNLVAPDVPREVDFLDLGCEKLR